MYKRILLAYDGSQTGQRALLESKELAQWMSAELHLVSVVPMYVEGAGIDGGFVIPEQAPDAGLAAQQAVLEEGLGQLRDSGHDAEGVVLTGDVVTEITDYASKIEADLIVVGHRHRSGWVARWWGGSNSKSLVEQANCSVLVVISHQD